MVVRWAVVAVTWMKEEDLRVLVDMLMCRGSEKYRGTRLWMAL